MQLNGFLFFFFLNGTTLSYGDQNQFFFVGIWCITVIEKLIMKSAFKADVLECCCARIALHCQGFGNQVDVRSVHAKLSAHAIDAILLTAASMTVSCLER